MNVLITPLLDQMPELGNIMEKKMLELYLLQVVLNLLHLLQLNLDSMLTLLVLMLLILKI